MILDKIALTEIVHCKSHSDKEISRICKAYCVEKWLQKILSLFNGKYIVIVGGAGFVFYWFVIKKKRRIKLANKRLGYLTDALNNKEWRWATLSSLPPFPMGDEFR